MSSPLPPPDLAFPTIVPTISTPMASLSPPATLGGAIDWQRRCHAAEQELTRLKRTLKEKEAELKKLHHKPDVSDELVAKFQTLSTLSPATTDEIYLRVAAELTHADAEKAAVVNRGNTSHEKVLLAAEKACMHVRLLRAIITNAVIPEARVIGSLHDALLTHDDRRDGVQEASEKIVRLGHMIQQLSGLVLRMLEKVELATEVETPLRKLHSRTAILGATQELRSQTVKVEDLVKAVTDKAPPAPTTLERYVPLDPLRFGRLCKDPERIVQIEAALVHKHRLRAELLAMQQSSIDQDCGKGTQEEDCERMGYGYKERDADYLLARSLMTGLEVADVLAGRIPEHIVASLTGSTANISDTPSETTAGAEEHMTVDSRRWWNQIAEEAEVFRPHQAKMICSKFELTAEEESSLNGPLLTAMILRATRTDEKWNAQHDVISSSILSITFGRQVVRRVQKPVRRVQAKTDRSSSAQSPGSYSRRRDQYRYTSVVAHKRKPSVSTPESVATARKHQLPPVIVQGLTGPALAMRGPAKPSRASV